MSDSDSPKYGSDWPEYFPFDSPYDDQAKAISQVLETASEHGYVALEGACGTGKTLISLLGGVSLIKDGDSPYERVLILTPNKQQQRVFIDDLRAINENLPSGYDRVSALTMVGKADLCPYSATDTFSKREVYGRCENLRDGVRQQIHGADTQKQFGRLAKMESNATANPESRDNTVGAPLTSIDSSPSDWTSPHQQEIPQNGNSEYSDYCPFYASWLKNRMEEEEHADYYPHGVVAPENIMKEGASQGFCPHAMMSSGIGNADVYIGNYKHLFDPLTFETMTSAIMDPGTYLICDEAHMLVPRVRDELGDSCSETSIQSSIDEVREQILQRQGEVREYIDMALEQEGVETEDLSSYIQFLEDLSDRVKQLAGQKAEDCKYDFSDRNHNIEELPDEITLSLRDPETPETDRLSDWISLAGYQSLFENSGDIGIAVSEVLEAASSELNEFFIGETYSDTVGRLLKRWSECDHREYFRQFVLKRRDRVYRNGDGWEQYYTAHLQLDNCIPSERIAERLSIAGGGILMSATLSPLDVYTETIGLDHLEEDGRPVETFISELNFPESHRESLTIDLPKYDYENRQSESVQSAYGDSIADVVETSSGNALIAMPSYQQAQWIAEYLQESPKVSTPDENIRADKSSSNSETEHLKEWFFSGEKKILATGLRGTLTTGIDYAGDRLSSVVVAGVPIRNIKSDLATAIQTAYESRYGEENGFEYAFTVPAVRKARQALGRPIRGADELGTRVLIDRRYAQNKEWDDVAEYLPEYERREFDVIDQDSLKQRLGEFWRTASVSPERTELDDIWE